MLICRGVSGKSMEVINTGVSGESMIGIFIGGCQ
jgi:hypothetical protein